MTRRCETCGADISALKSTARYCGSGCRARAWEDRHLPESPPEAFVGVQGLRPAQRRALHTLRDAGDEGVTTSDFIRTGCGSRFGGRIHELREMGYVIDAKRERQGRHRYRLVSEPAGKESSREPIGSGEEMPRLNGSPSTGASNPGAPGGQLVEPAKAAPRGYADPEDVVA